MNQTSHVWRPWSLVTGDALQVARGDGYRVWDSGGRVYLDATAGAANLSCDHAHPALIQAATAQLRDLPHFDMSAAIHVPARHLADRLTDLLPGNLAWTFFVNSGSEATEVAIRIALDFWRNVGKDRTRVVSLADGYHGSTLLAQTLSGLPITAHPYAEPVEVTRVRLPLAPAQMRKPAALDPLVSAVAEAFDATNVPPAAVILEPLLNVGGGVVLPAGFLRAVRQLCDAAGTLLIVDEVFTGFGRTGKMFGCDHDGVAPDILMAGKGLAGGYVPLATVSTTMEIYEAFLPDSVSGGLRYGHATSGHAVACAVALAAIDVILKDDLVNRAAELGEFILDELSDLPVRGVEDVRGLGLTITVEMSTAELAQQVVATARQLGLLVRQQGRVVMAVPPLILDSSGAEDIVRLLRQAILAVTTTVDAPNGRSAAR